MNWLWLFHIKTKHHVNNWRDKWYWTITLSWRQQAAHSHIRCVEAGTQQTGFKKCGADKKDETVGNKLLERKMLTYFYASTFVKAFLLKLRVFLSCICLESLCFLWVKTCWLFGLEKKKKRMMDNAEVLLQVWNTEFCISLTYLKKTTHFLLGMKRVMENIRK